MGPLVGVYTNLAKGWPSGVEPERPSMPFRRVSRISATSTASAWTSSNQPLSRTGTVRPTIHYASNTITTTKLAKKHEVDLEHNMVCMGGISDEDKINGPERKYAINSPLKGKRRLTSLVMPYDFLYLIFDFNLIYLPGSHKGWQSQF